MIEQSARVLNGHEVAQAVRKYLQPHLSNGITLEVVESAIREEKFWWSVPIRPSAEPTRRYEFYEALADAEQDLSEKEHLKILLTPFPPADES